MSYSTLARVQAEIKGTEAAKAAGTDQQIMGYIRTVTEHIRLFRFEFEPYYDTKRFTPLNTNVNSVQKLLTLSDYLLEPKTITVNGVAGVWGTDIQPYPNQTPYRTLRIANPTTGPLQSWYPRTFQQDDYIECIAVAGFWGMRRDYATSGFFDSVQNVPVGGLSASAVTMTLADVLGPDAYNRTPLFSPGNLLRIEDELIDVIKVDSKTLTLIRGTHGTSAIAHAAGTDILIWEAEEDITNCATRQAALLYARRGAYQQVTTYPDGISVTYPSDLLQEVRATVQRFNMT